MIGFQNARVEMNIMSFGSKTVKLGSFVQQWCFGEFQDAWNRVSACNELVNMYGKDQSTKQSSLGSSVQQGCLGEFEDASNRVLACNRLVHMYVKGLRSNVLKISEFQPFGSITCF